MMKAKNISRRDFLRAAGTGLFLAGARCVLPLPAWAVPASNGIRRTAARRRYDLTIGYSPIEIDGRQAVSTGINGTVPGPLVHLREGDQVTLNVTNQMMDTAHSSIHWQQNRDTARKAFLPPKNNQISPLSRICQ